MFSLRLSNDGTFRSRLLDMRAGLLTRLPSIRVEWLKPTFPKLQRSDSSGFTCFTGSSLLLGTWGAPLGEYRRSQELLPLPHIGFHLCEAPTIKGLLPYTNMVGFSLNTPSFILARASFLFLIMVLEVWWKISYKKRKKFNDCSEGKLNVSLPNSR